MAYSDEQMAAALRQAGVPAGPAAYLVATAHPESGASNVEQQGQPYATTGWGVWQITPGNSEPQVATNSGLLNLQSNARAAAAKYRQQGLGAWTTITSGKEDPYLTAAKAAVAKVYGMSMSEVDKLASSAGGGSGGGGSGGGSGSGGGAQSAELTSFLSAPSGVLTDAGSLLHGSAMVLDRVFGMFAPGQGWRIIFWAAAATSGFGAYKAYTTDTDEQGSRLPLAIALLGVAFVAAFMAARPWPQTSQGPIRVGAYAVDVLEGRPPPAGPEAVTAGEVHLTEAGLAALLGLWAAGKAGQAASGIASGISAGAGILGGLWGWIKGLGGEAGAAAGGIAEIP